MIDRTSILEPVSNIDLRKLAINAREAYVLSQVDGQLTLEELDDLVATTASRWPRSSSPPCSMTARASTSRRRSSWRRRTRARRSSRR